MLYPKFAEKNGTIGITAPSAGVGDKIDSFERSLQALRDSGFNIVETENVRKNGAVSSTGRERAKQLEELIRNKVVDYLIMAAGGDFLPDMLPCLDFNLISQYPKWIQGYSDITNLLYPITTKLDIATVYGLNAGGFDRRPLHRYQQTAVDLITGNTDVQISFDKCSTLETRDGDFTAPVYWNAVNGNFKADGRLLGGCLDCLCETVAGTKYDGTADFINRYTNDRIIWYFDVFSMSAEAVARGLWKLKQLGWFENAAAFIFGRIMLPSTFVNMTYEEAILRELGGTSKIVTNADIGHLPPTMTLINGACASLSCFDGKAKLKISLK